MLIEIQQIGEGRVRKLGEWKVHKWHFLKEWKRKGGRSGQMKRWMNVSKCFQWNMNRTNCCATPSSLMFNMSLFICSASLWRFLALSETDTQRAQILPHSNHRNRRNVLFRLKIISFYIQSVLNCCSVFIIINICHGKDAFYRVFAIKVYSICNIIV